MTEMESALRDHLHASLDPLQSGPTTTEDAVRAGRRRTRVRKGVAATMAVAAVGLGSVVLFTSHDSGSRSQVASSSLGARTAAYARNLTNDDVGALRDAMTASTRAALTAELLHRGWAEVKSAYGEVRSVGAAVHDGDSPDTWRVPVTMQNGTVNVRVSYNHAGQVIGVTVLSAGATSSNPLLEPATRRLVADLAAGRYTAARARFDDRMRSGLPADELGLAWRLEAVRRHGGFVRIASITTLQVKGNTVQRALCDMGKGQMVVQVAYDDSGQVTGLFLLEP